MKIIENIAELQEISHGYRFSGKNTVLVPTMGYFHWGHETLMAFGRQLADKLIVSLFVNPTQFAPTEDFSSYPRDLDKDIATAKKYGVDILFIPKADDLYFPDSATWVTVDELSNTLCGLSRPTHFRGVCTVVLKLFMLTLANKAIFGQKDWQQLTILKRMVRDLNLPTEIVSCPTVREGDGLALSSRNSYLTAEERQNAPHFFHGLMQAKEALTKGKITSTSELAEIVRSHWGQFLPKGGEDYLAFVEPDTLKPVVEITAPCVVAAAYKMGKPRLIDNLLLVPEDYCE